MHHHGLTETFRHRPLDPTEQSIRLIRIRPKLSVDGLLVCDVRHARISSRYQCLSYRWGCQEQSRIVLMRNIAPETSSPMPLHISQNLYDFLAIARQKRWLCKWFWIDALCIDQINTAERSHQVAHMGHIYAHALKVVVWLGKTSTRYRRSMSATDVETYRSFVLENEYWNRAWITQEIVLARNVAVLINDTATSLRKLVDRLSDGLPQSWLRSPMRVLVNTGLLLRFGDTKPRLLDLIQNEAWANKKCTIPRDRFFSILELVQEGRDIAVDYDSSPIDLACNILRACSNVLCSCPVLALLRALGVDELAGFPSLCGLMNGVVIPLNVFPMHLCPRTVGVVHYSKRVSSKFS